MKNCFLKTSYKFFSLIPLGQGVIPVAIFLHKSSRAIPSHPNTHTTKSFVTTKTMQCSRYVHYIYILCDACTYVYNFIYKLWHRYPRTYTFRIKHLYSYVYIYLSAHHLGTNGYTYKINRFVSYSYIRIYFFGNFFLS